jgi:hypothetical protein
MFIFFVTFACGSFLSGAVVDWLLVVCPCQIPLFFFDDIGKAGWSLLCGSLKIAGCWSASPRRRGTTKNIYVVVLHERGKKWVDRVDD